MGAGAARGVPGLVEEQQSCRRRTAPTGLEPSNQERSRSRVSPGNQAEDARPAARSARRGRGRRGRCRGASSPTGVLASVRTRPERSTALRSELPALAAVVEPDLLARGRPGESLIPDVRPGTSVLAFPARSDDHEDAPPRASLEEGDAVARRRERAGRRMPRSELVEDLAERQLEPVAALEERGRRRAACRRASSPRTRRTRRSARGAPPPSGTVASVPMPAGSAEEALAQRDRELARSTRRRGGRRSCTPTRRRLRALRARRVDLDAAVPPRRRRRRRSGRPARSAPSRCCRGGTSAAGKSGGEGFAARQRKWPAATPAASAARASAASREPPDARRAAGPPARPIAPALVRRRSRQRLEVEREVVRRVEALLGVLLEAVAHDALEARARCSGS